MKANVLSLEGKVLKQVALPKAFQQPVRRDIITRAVLSEESFKRQPKGNFPLAGIQTTAEYRGRKEAYGSIKNHGISRLPREKFPKGRFGRVRIVPFSVKGRRAHPPVPEKKITELMNKKEKLKALASAVSATASPEVVRQRGHSFNGLSLPLVIDSSVESVSKTSAIVKLFQSLGLSADVERSSKRKRVTGVRRRVGGYRERKSILLVVGDDKGVLKAARNIPGVDVSIASKLSVSLLAPGGVPGRLALWSESALEKLKDAGV